ncbi:transcriptional corepressor LEUNIG_HOMOLOG-like [Gastrolobium bilobum]|uniref:transcriptional corepressor LEUNIG_HOMOLOG-like n=1 Tax=Gastrolobium bilobum TaxID=150636 RepID=UPI002AB1936F|nr:transcriptional corepressor LEUNIG_HOMOLOG-like [Gastrolobium bilobum]XP_061373571.1 transcriptional corepressor LEUNIG_HOMOLOG-like [Gastrolobium bilobum]
MSPAPQATELDIRMLEELMSTNFLQPSQSWITQIEQKFLVELDAGDFLFEEVTCHHQSSIRENFLSCHFSEDGRFLACAGHGRKVTIWNKEDSNFTTSQESHSDVITEVRFRSSHRLTTCATSSYDRTVKIWDAAYPHMVYATVNVNLGSPILSLDFHPRDRDLLCCCDANDFIQLWNISLYAYRLCYFKGHSKEVISICWDQSGNYIASVSEDEACFWSAAPEGGLPYVLACKHGKFESCIFHPRYPNLLIISGHKCLDFWIPQRGYSLDFLDDGGIFTGVATSPQTQMVASVSRDCVKLWKTCS